MGTTIAFRCSEDLQDRLKAGAQERNTTVSKLVIRAVEELLARAEQNEPNGKDLTVTFPVADMDRFERESGFVQPDVVPPVEGPGTATSYGEPDQRVDKDSGGNPSSVQVLDVSDCIHPKDRQRQVAGGILCLSCKRVRKLNERF